MAIPTLIGLFTVLGTAAASGAPDAPAAGEPPVPDLSGAVEAEPADDAFFRFLKPLRVRLPQNPYGSIDFTAYTLEPGEVRLGLASVHVGVAPRVQLGTVPVLDALGVYNGSAKLNLVRVGPVDLALQGSHYQLPIAGFVGRQTNLGGMASVQVVGGWSIHAGATYNLLSAEGAPDLTDLPPALLAATGGADLESANNAIQQFAGQTAVDTTARAVTVKVATDVRFNRRDSLVLQGQAMVWGGVQSEGEEAIPPILGLDQALADREGQIPVQDTYVASAAWQMQWKRAELRIGAGISSVPGAWLVQSTDFAWRFGGKTKRDERKLRGAWRDNKRLIEKAERRQQTPETAADAGRGGSNAG